jgi:hypothetical protein
MLDSFVGALESASQKLDDFMPVIRVDKTQREQTSALAVHTRVRSTVWRGKVGLDDCHSLRKVSFVNHAQRSSSRELGPVGRLGKPLEVLAEKCVRRCTGICVRVCEGDSRMVDR